jgi:hypothetical protein
MPQRNVSTPSSKAKFVPALGAGALLAALAVFGDSPVRADELASTQGPDKSSEEWVIEIRPLQTEDSAAVTGIAPAPATQGPVEMSGAAAPGTLVPRMTYVQAMAQIPFNREEYEANPSYRHDAAMELMFGALRPTTIMKMNMPYFSRYPDFFRNRFQIYPYMNQGSAMNFNYLWSTNAYTNSW